MSQFNVSIVTKGDIKAIDDLEIKTRAQLETAEKLKKQYDALIPTMQAGSKAQKDLQQASDGLQKALDDQSAKLVKQREQLIQSARAMEQLGTEASKAAAKQQRQQADDIQKQLGNDTGPLAKVKQQGLEIYDAYNQAGGGIRGFIGAMKAGGTTILIWAAAMKTFIGLASKAHQEITKVDDAMVGLNAALKLNGEATAETRAEYKALAEVMENETGVAAHKWIGILEQMTQGGARASEIAAVTVGVKALAGMMGGDLAQSASVMQAAMEGNFQALERYGIFTHENESMTERFNDALQQINEKGMGAYSDKAESITGLTEKLGTETGDLLKIMFGWTETPVKAILYGIGESMEWVNEKLKTAKDAWHSWGEQLGPFEALISPLTFGLRKMNEALGDNEEASQKAANAAKILRENSEAYERSLKAEKMALDEASQARDIYSSNVSAQGRREIEMVNAQKKLELAKLEQMKKGGMNEAEYTRRKMNIEANASNRIFAIEERDAQTQLYGEDGKGGKAGELREAEALLSSKSGELSMRQDIAKVMQAAGADERRGGDVYENRLKKELETVNEGRRKAGLPEIEFDQAMLGGRQGEFGTQNRAALSLLEKQFADGGEFSQMRMRVGRLRNEVSQGALNLQQMRAVRAVEAQASNITRQGQFSEVATQERDQHAIDKIERGIQARNMAMERPMSDFRRQRMQWQNDAGNKLKALHQKRMAASQETNIERRQGAMMELSKAVNDYNEWARRANQQAGTIVAPMQDLSEWSAQNVGLTRQGRGIVQEVVGDTLQRQRAMPVNQHAVGNQTAFLANSAGNVIDQAFDFSGRERQSEMNMQRNIRLGYEWTTGWNPSRFVNGIRDESALTPGGILGSDLNFMNPRWETMENRRMRVYAQMYGARGAQLPQGRIFVPNAAQGQQVALDPSLGPAPGAAPIMQNRFQNPDLLAMGRNGALEAVAEMAEISAQGVILQAQANDNWRAINDAYRRASAASGELRQQIMKEIESMRQEMADFQSRMAANRN